MSAINTALRCNWSPGQRTSEGSANEGCCRQGARSTRTCWKPGHREEDAWRKGAGSRPGARGRGTGQVSGKGVRPRGGSRRGQGIRRSRKTHHRPCSQQAPSHLTHRPRAAERPSRLPEQAPGSVQGLSTGGLVPAHPSHFLPSNTRCSLPLSTVLCPSCFCPQRSHCLCPALCTPGTVNPSDITLPEKSLATTTGPCASHIHGTC